MPKIEFTAPTVKALRENTDTTPGTYFDTKLPGFGLRVSKRTRKFVVVGYVAGKKVWVTQGPSEMTLPTARKWAEGVLGDLARGINPNAAKAEQRAAAMKLSEALDTYLNDNDLKESTATENRRLIERDLKDWLNKDVKSITRQMVVTRFDKLTERSPAIANHVFWVLRAILNHTRVVTKNDLGEFTLPPNPCDRLTDLKRWHKPQARKGTVAIDQFPTLMDALAETDQTFADYIMVLLRTGMRRTEAASLRWTDISFDASTFTIRAEVAKNKKAVTLPASKQVMAIFERRRNGAPDTLHVFGDSKRYDPRKSLLKLRKSLGSDLTYHDCRRTFLQLAENQEVPTGFIKKLANHTDSRDVTAAHYTNQSDAEALRPYTQRISDQIDRLGHLDNPDLAARDALDSLKKAIEGIEEYEQFAPAADRLKRIITELA